MNGNALIYIGILLIVAGIVYKMGWLSWFGNLPGDIKYHSEHSAVFVPITSMIVVSIIISLILHFFGR